MYVHMYMCVQPRHRKLGFTALRPVLGPHKVYYQRQFSVDAKKGPQEVTKHAWTHRGKNSHVDISAPWQRPIPLLTQKERRVDGNA